MHFHRVFKLGWPQGWAAEGDEIPILTFKTRSRFCFLQSRSSRREREFFSFNLRVRDEIKNFCNLISKFETRSRFFNEKGRWCYHCSALLHGNSFPQILQEAFPIGELLKIFIISLFETRSRSRIFSIKSRILRRGREIKKDISWSSENSRC